LRRPERFALALDAAACDYFGRGGGPRPEWAPRAAWLAALDAVRSLDAGAIARSCANKERIPQAIHAARVDAVRALGLRTFAASPNPADSTRT
jgi:tRNA nucleotidyltransferase (CCA-adding enzyme)